LRFPHPQTHHKKNTPAGSRDSRVESSSSSSSSSSSRKKTLVVDIRRSGVPVPVEKEEGSVCCEKKWESAQTASLAA
jgi:hypothetical protein